MNARPDIARHNVAEAVRIWRGGGRGWILLPDSQQGTVHGVRIEQPAAEEIIARYLDLLMSDLAAREQRGAPLSGADTAQLRNYRESVPHAWVWLVSDGENVLLAENYYGMPIGMEYVLAVHPDECAGAVGWDVPRNSRRAGFKSPVRLNVSPAERRVTVATLHFPPGVGLFAAWGAFERLNTARMLERLSPEDRRRYLEPYSMRVRGDREEVLNRFYRPIHERPADGAPDGQHWFYDDGHSEAEQQRRAKAAAERLGIGRHKN